MTNMIWQELDGGDLHKSMQKHRFRKIWLMEAEKLLGSQQDVLTMSPYDITKGDWPAIYCEIPRSVWEPQLREQVEEAKKQIDMLDKIVRDYVDKALA